MVIDQVVLGVWQVVEAGHQQREGRAGVGGEGGVVGEQGVASGVSREGRPGWRRWGSGSYAGVARSKENSESMLLNNRINMLNKDSIFDISLRYYNFLIH